MLHALVDTSNKVPGGGLCGTAADLVHFAHALIAGKLLKKETVDAMWKKAKTKDGKATRYGLGFHIWSEEKPRRIGHGGGQPRVSTLLVIRPDEGVVVSLMSNLERARLRKLANRLGAQVIGSGKCSGKRSGK